MSILHLPYLPKLKARLDQHPLYTAVRTPADLRCFMQHHVYAVWDFMSLLKYLQGAIAPVSLPWQPTGDAALTAAQRLINEIVLGEETDEGLPDANGQPSFISHFDLYLGAMQEVGADTAPVLAFLRQVKKKGVDKALRRADIPEPSRRFMTSTFDVIDAGRTPAVAAAFALGREQVIPGMFRALLADLGISRQQAPLFHYYLERHIHLDGELHGPLSLNLLAHLCGDSAAKLRQVERAAKKAVKARVALWDAVHAELKTL